MQVSKFDLASIQRKAKYGRKSWLVWQTPSGNTCYGVVAIPPLEKMLQDIGPGGEFRLIGKGTGHIHGYSAEIGLNMLRQLKRRAYD